MSLSSSLSSPSSIIQLAKRKIGSDDDTTFQQTTTTTKNTIRILKSTRQDTNIQYHSKRIRNSRSSTSTTSRFLTSILLILFLSSCSIPFPFQNKNHPIGFANAAEDDKCASELSYTCPNCGGTQISDCLDCNGFLNTGECLFFVFVFVECYFDWIILLVLSSSVVCLIDGLLFLGMFDCLFWDAMLCLLCCA